jgi:hypothetical membrane protein
MPSKNLTYAGSLQFIGGVQFVIALFLAESVYSGYSVSTNMISDLGVWGKPSAPIFNVSTAFFGLTLIASSYFLNRQFRYRGVAALFAVAGAGALGVGLFPENTFMVGSIPVLHSLSALLAFVVGGLSAISAYKITKPPFRYIPVFLGVFAIVAFAVFLATRDQGALGVGAGCLERFVAYPTVLLMIGLGGYFLGTKEENK